MVNAIGSGLCGELNVGWRMFIVLSLIAVALFRVADTVVPDDNKVVTSVKEREYHHNLSSQLGAGIVPGLPDSAHIVPVPPPTTGLAAPYHVTTAPGQPIPSNLPSKAKVTGIAVSSRPPVVGGRRPSRNECCAVGQAYARMNGACNLLVTHRLFVTSSTSGADLETRSKTKPPASVWPSGVGQRLERKLRRCQFFDGLQIHTRRCCLDEKKQEAIRKCRLEKRRLCTERLIGASKLSSRVTRDRVTSTTGHAVIL